MIVVNIAGKMHSGKSFLAGEIASFLIKQGYSIYKTSYARALKEFVFDVFGARKGSFVTYRAGLNFSEIMRNIELFRIRYGLLYVESKVSIRKKLQPLINKTVLEYYGRKIYDNSEKATRYLLQQYGTEIFKTAFGNNVWVNIVVRSLDYIQTDFVILDDRRFDEEQIHNAVNVLVECDDRIRAKRGRVTLEELNTTSKHKSEELNFTSDLVVDSEELNADLTNIQTICYKIIEKHGEIYGGREGLRL